MISPAGSPRQLTTPPGASANALVGLARQRAEPPGDLGGDDPLDRAAQGAILKRRRAALRLEMEAGEAADQMALDRHRAVGIDAAKDRARAIAQAAQQRARAPVDETLHQRLVQRVGEPVLEASRPALPCLRIGEPVGAIGDIGERAHAREPRRQRVDVAVGAVEARELALHPVFGQAPVALRQMLEQRPDQARVLVLRRLTEIRRLADLPQPYQVGPIATAPDRP